MDRGKRVQHADLSSVQSVLQLALGTMLQLQTHLLKSNSTNFTPLSVFKVLKSTTAFMKISSTQS